MKRLLLFVCVLLSLCAYSQNEDKIIPEFSGIKIDSSVSIIVKKLKAKGYKVEDDKSDGAVVLRGLMGGEEVDVFLLYTPKTKLVWKLAVFFKEQSTWTSIKREYEKLKDILIEKYGEPTKKYEFFSKPYYEGDGYEMSALRLEKISYVTIWDKQSMILKIGSTKQVIISYENYINAEIKSNEEKKGLSDNL